MFLDPGLGKTVVAYSAYQILKAAGHVRSLLVVTMLRPMYQVWPREIEKWGLELKYVILHGRNKNKLLRQKADVYIINYDGLSWLYNNFLNKIGVPLFDMVVFDESSKLRNTNTLRFKIVRKILFWFKRRYILTGSPAPRSLMNLFGQIFVLDNGEALGQYITHFRNKHFNVTMTSPYGPIAFELKTGADKKIHEAIKHLVIRFDETEIDMPKLVSDYEPKKDKLGTFVELPAKARRIYDELKRDLITAIDQHIVIAKNAGVATMKLRQVANGGLYVKEGLEREAKRIHDAKTEATIELLEGLEGRTSLVGYEFRHDRDRLLAALPRGTPYIDGTVAMKRTLEIIDEWNRGNIETLLGNVPTIANGNNMQEVGHAVIFHSLVWDYEAYDQFVRRVYRQGQKAKRLFLYHIVARNTIDEAVLTSMQNKGATQAELFLFLKQHLEIVK